jgi:hypothetical protein
MRFLEQRQENQSTTPMMRGFGLPSEAGRLVESSEPTPEMIANGRAITLSMPERFPMNLPDPVAGDTIKPVLVHVEIDIQGNVFEEELLSAADPALAERALQLVKSTRFAAQGTQRQAAVNIYNDANVRPPRSLPPLPLRVVSDSARDHVLFLLKADNLLA